MYASGGRAYPDVSSLGNAYAVVIGGQTYQLSGTSGTLRFSRFPLRFDP